MNNHAINIAMMEAIRSRIKTDLIGIFSQFGILELDVQFDESNVRQITVTVPFSKKHKNLSLKIQGIDQLNFMKENGFKCNLFWTDKEKGQVLHLIMEKEKI